MTKYYIPKQFLGAFRCGHREASKEFIDETLSHKLLRRVLESDYKDLPALDLLNYITKFNNEFHKNVIKKGDPTALHNTDKLRRECYARENARNRDFMSARNYMKVDAEDFQGLSYDMSDDFDF